MSKYTINIGLANPFTGTNNSIEKTLYHATDYIQDIEDIAIKQSATERTVVIKFNKIVRSLTVLACALDQDCVALYNNDAQFGVLYGDKSDQWGPFNKEYFLEI